MAQTLLSPTLELALGTLRSTGVQWFDQNPYAAQGPSEINAPESPSPWDQVTILGYTFYGKVTGKISTKVDIRPQQSSNNTVIINNGRRPSPINVTLYILVPEDLARMTQLIPTILVMSNARQSISVQCQHLLMMGQTSSGQTTQLYLLDADLPEPPSGGKPASIKLTFQPWLNIVPSVTINGPPIKNLPTPPLPVPPVPPASSPYGATGWVGFSGMDNPNVTPVDTLGAPAPPLLSR